MFEAILVEDQALERPNMELKLFVEAMLVGVRAAESILCMELSCDRSSSS